MRKGLWCSLLLLVSVVFCSVAFAGEKTQKNTDLPWETFSLNLGGFISTVDSSIGLGVNSIGVDIDLEDSLGLDTSITAFRVDTFWRFTDNKRHRFDFSWFDLNRDSTKVLAKDIPIGENEFPAGATISSSLDMSILKATYSYSFFQDDRFDLAASAGLFVIPIDYSIRSITNRYNGYEADSITAPLPVIGLRGDFAITPKLFFKTNIDFFYVEFDNYEGSIVDVRMAVEYNLFKNVGFGLGFEHVQVDVEAEGDSDVPGVNFNGNILFDYSGVLLYTKIYF
jgi:hypothetical protein